MGRIENETETFNSLGYTYMINPGTLYKVYKDVMSYFHEWDQLEHAEDWILLGKNLGKDLGIDETSLHGEVYTIVHNKEAHGRKGAIVAIVKGTKPSVVSDVINQIPESERSMVESITMDLSDSMRAIARESFPFAVVIRDFFHTVKRVGEACEEMRLKLKRLAVSLLKKEKAKFHHHLMVLASQRKGYTKRMKAKHGKSWKKSNRGRKPLRINAKFTPPRLPNGETHVELLTRCSKQLAMSRDKWSKSQEERGKILFGLYPKLEEVYNLTQSFRCVFRDKTLTIEAARVKLHEWYDKVTACTIREIKSARDTIKNYEDEILNYFIAHQTNASAESLNSKIKCFRAQVKGVKDIPFFMYRLTTVLG